MKLVIDADQLCYAAGFASEGEPLANTLHLVKKMLHSMLDETGTEHFEVYIGGKGNYREDIAITQGYKANRTSRKPEAYAEIREYLCKAFNATVVDGIEADDKVSMLLWEDYVQAGGDPNECKVMLSSPDKDLNNTPGWHYNPRTKEVKWVTERQAHRHFCYQLLAGDRVDNIAGLPYCTDQVREMYGLSAAAKKGCGEGSAKKIMAALGTVADPLPYIYECYASWAIAEGLDITYLAEYINEQGGLLWMLREFGTFDEPVVWTSDLNEVVSADARMKAYGHDNGGIGTRGSTTGAGDDTHEATVAVSADANATGDAGRSVGEGC